MVADGAGYTSEGFVVGHLLSEVVFAEMDDDLLDAILEDLVLAADVEVIKELLLSLCDLVLLVHKVVHVSKVLVKVQFLPEHC